MLAVSDTSPISNLAAIGRLHLLESQFPALRVPPAVVDELMVHPDAGALSAIQAGLRQQWIGMASPPDTKFLRVLRAGLHAGEAEAIALAAELNADIILLDEREARKLAMGAGFRITGVLGILLRAKQTGEIPVVGNEIRALRERARIFVKPELEEKVLRAAGE